MHDDQFWLLVSLKLSGEATEEELADLEALLQEHPEMGLRLDILFSLWKGQDPASFSRRGDALGRHLQRLNSHLSAVPTRGYRVFRRLWPEGGLVRKAWTMAGVAASLIVFFLFIYPAATPKKKRPIAQNTVSTKPGSQSKVQLPDGTQVWLNADSRITYDESFMGLNRELRLCGEAYFDVAKDKNHPFIIHTSSIDVKVLGTSLNVRSYNNEKNTEAVLIHGSIEITLRNNPDKKIVLEPNEKLVVQNGVTPVVASAPQADPRGERRPVMVLEKAHFQQQDSIATEVLWVKNKLAFDQETLEDVALKIERWYDVKVTIREESLKHTEYSGVFENESLSQVMEALRLTGNFRYSVNKKEVIITL
jgi:transmembrane sensor